MFADEKAVWAFMRPRLPRRGWKWERVEAAQPAGMPDVHGMCGRRSVWIELKETTGAPRRSLLRVPQRQWLDEAHRVGAEIYVVFGTPAGLVWFNDPKIVTPMRLLPDFWDCDRVN